MKGKGGRGALCITWSHVYRPLRKLDAGFMETSKEIKGKAVSRRNWNIAFPPTSNYIKPARKRRAHSHSYVCMYACIIYYICLCKHPQPASQPATYFPPFHLFFPFPFAFPFPAPPPASSLASLSARSSTSTSQSFWTAPRSRALTRSAARPSRS